MYNIWLLQAVLYGHPMPKDADGNKCTLDGMANPDNIHYTNDIMFLAEDTSSHLNNVLWAWDMTSSECHSPLIWQKVEWFTLAP